MLQALCTGFGDKSKLFRHEIAYVLGQMMEPATVPALFKVLQNESEHKMVRHEAAEALGAIGTEEAEMMLEKYKEDEQTVVRESCEVALDVIDYWTEA
jgi:deoxyhypusine monooxygenase